MGAGKTKMAIDFCNGMDARFVLILCPKSVVDVWPAQLRMHSGQSYIVWAEKSGTVADRAGRIQQHIEAALSGRTRLAVVLNYEAFWRAPLGPVYDKNRFVKKGVLSIPWDVLICDEAHRIKSPNGKASWGAMRIAKSANRRLFLSGTPMPNSPTDIYAQFRALDPDIFGTSFTRFRARYCIMGGFQGKQVLGFQNESELNAKFYSKAFRVTKDEVLADLPPVMHETRYADLSPKAAKIYRDLEQDFIARVDSGEITVNNALVKLLRLSQVCGGFVKLDDGTGKTVCNAKMDVLADLFEDIDAKEPIVVFSRFTNEVERTRALADKMGRPAAELSGNVNELKAWQDGKFNVLAVQVKSGGVGVDFTRARYCVYMSKGFLSPGEYDQTLARTHRPGQRRSVVYYHILARNTVDERMEIALKTKGNVIADILESFQAQCRQAA